MLHIQRGKREKVILTKQIKLSKDGEQLTVLI